MGLDMYLSAEKYLPGYDHCKTTEKSLFNKVLKTAGLTRNDITDGSPSATLSVNVAYWRKANAIHGWFVKNIQNGKDECQRSYVSRDNLQKLVDECKQALDEKDKPTKTVLEPQSGFFFGTTDRDEWYYQDLQETVTVLEAILKNKRLQGWEFYYQASW